jgi:hypothetical protein
VGRLAVQCNSLLIPPALQKEEAPWRFGVEKQLVPVATLKHTKNNEGTNVRMEKGEAGLFQKEGTRGWVRGVGGVHLTCKLFEAFGQKISMKRRNERARGGGES